MYVVYLFFFFKQKTAYEMRISDWSSDVCSSDLVDPADDHAALGREQRHHAGETGEIHRRLWPVDIPAAQDESAEQDRIGEAEQRDAAIEDERKNARPARQKIGRASCRERVCQYV